MSFLILEGNGGVLQQLNGCAFNGYIRECRRVIAALSGRVLNNLARKVVQVYKVCQH